jgi:transcriptional regulator
MYVPSHFAEHDVERLSRFVDDHPLATLAVVRDGRLEAHHLPVLRLGPLATGSRLIAHAARGNPLWRLAESGVDVLLVFSGAPAYVSPSYYPGKAEHGRVVPTYNYAAVHVHGQLDCSHDELDKREAVERLTAHLERGRAQPWSVADAPADYVSAMLRGIVALSVSVHSVEAKFKASQNKSPADQRGVSQGLRGDATTSATAEAAALIEEHLAGRTKG